MKCEACLETMDELIEGALDETLAREATAHMAMCGQCSELFAKLRDEQELYRKYLPEVEPTPAAWANLRLALEKEKVLGASQPPFRRSWLSIALGGLKVTPQIATALVIITIGLAIGILVWRTTIDASKDQVQNAGSGTQPASEGNRAGTDRSSENTDRRAPVDADDRRILSSSPKGGDRRETRITAAGRAGRRVIERTRAVPTVDQVARRAEQQYLSAIEILSRDIKHRRALISPVLLSQFEKALKEVDRNIAATRRVAREQPRDPYAVQYVALAYEKKVELLRELTSE